MLEIPRVVGTESKSCSKVKIRKGGKKLKQKKGKEERGIRNRRRNLLLFYERVGHKVDLKCFPFVASSPRGNVARDSPWPGFAMLLFELGPGVGGLGGVGIRESTS